MGYATITHPFHPLNGKQFKILYTTTFDDRDILSLAVDATGTITILRDWTDLADVPLYADLSESPPILSLQHLLALSKFLEQLNESSAH